MEKKTWRDAVNGGGRRTRKREAARGEWPTERQQASCRSLADTRKLTKNVARSSCSKQKKSGF